MRINPSKLRIQYRAGFFAVLALLCLGVRIATAVEVVESDEAAVVAAEIDVDVSSESETSSTAQQATHQQTALIKIVDDTGSPLSLNAICLASDGNLLAATGTGPGEIRVYRPDGEFVTAWPVDVKPESVYCSPAGNVIVAGSGKMIKLDAKGNVLLETPSPHATSSDEEIEQLRVQIRDRAKTQREALGKRLGVYETQIETSQKQIDTILEIAEEERTDIQKRRLKALEKTIGMYKSAMDNYRQYMETLGGNELTDEQIEQQVQSRIAYANRVSSVSATDKDVYLACPATAGYGFDVWRMDENFENAQKIITGLRGCCGQMDVKANADGVFVAENAQFRVSQYDRDGKVVRHWGKRERAGDEGFGSCCNPMNVAFGPDGHIYTGEATVGRIKSYDLEGKLCSTIGKVELVPGCKNVSIAVSDDGKRVFMMDITRQHIAVLTAPAESTP